jgi:hypothetical protein
VAAAGSGTRTQVARSRQTPARATRSVTRRSR